MNVNQEMDFFFNRRSIRRFKQKQIPDHILKECINCARLAPTGKNLQPLDFILVTDESLRSKIFSHLHWAGYLPSWDPSENEQPMAYIVVIYKKNNSSLINYDVGIALAHIILFAEAHNIGSCLLKNIDVDEIQRVLHIPSSFSVDSVIALGYKNEHPVIETDDHQRKYWHDDQKQVHVPKRSLDTVLHNQTF